MYNKFKNIHHSEKGVFDLATIGERIRQLRTGSNLSQEEFGKQFGIVKSTVSLYENGKSIPDDQTKLRICEHYGVTMDWLYGLSSLAHIDLGNGNSVFHFDFEFSNRLEKLMKDSHITEDVLSDKIGVSVEEISSLKKGGTPDLMMLIALADYFHVTVDYLLCRSSIQRITADEEMLLDSYEKCDEDSKKYIMAKAGVLCVEGISAVAASEISRNEKKPKKSFPSNGTEGIA